MFRPSFSFAYYYNAQNLKSVNFLLKNRKKSAADFSRASLLLLNAVPNLRGGEKPPLCQKGGAELARRGVYPLPVAEGDHLILFPVFELYRCISAAQLSEE